jgi:hypothetical protein
MIAPVSGLEEREALLSNIYRRSRGLEMTSADGAISPKLELYGSPRLDNLIFLNSWL